MKECSKCGQTKSLSDFHRNRTHNGGYAQWCKICTLAYNAQHKEEINEWHKNKRLENRLKVLSAYGGKCICCDESEQIFLTIDHIDEKGAEHREQFKNHIYEWLISNKYPKLNFQLLCMNCNWAKHINGVCPHQSITKPR